MNMTFIELAIPYSDLPMNNLPRGVVESNKTARINLETDYVNPSSIDFPVYDESLLDVYGLGEVFDLEAAKVQVGTSAQIQDDVIVANIRLHNTDSLDSSQFDRIMIYGAGSDGVVRKAEGLPGQCPTPLVGNHRLNFILGKIGPGQTTNCKVQFSEIPGNLDNFHIWFTLYQGNEPIIDSGAFRIDEPAQPAETSGESNVADAPTAGLQTLVPPTSTAASTPEPTNAPNAMLLTETISPSLQDSIEAIGTAQSLVGEEKSDPPGTDLEILPGVETVPIENMDYGIPWLPMDPNKIPAVYYYAFNTSIYPFDNPKVRQAFSLSIDNSDFARFVNGGGKPAATFTHPDVLGRDQYDQDGMGFDPQLARELLEDAGFPNGDYFPLVRLSFLDSGSGHEMAEKARDMWRDTLGVEVELNPASDFNDYIRFLSTEPQPLYGIGWVADINDPDNFFSPLFHSNGEYNRANYSSEKLDRVVESAATLGDPAARQQLYLEAEKIILEEDAVVIPLYHYYVTN